MKIFYGICGEGMGHGGRSLALIERLRGLGHRVTVFTFADAYRLLTTAGYQPHRIEGLQFRMRRDGSVDPLRSVCNFVSFQRRRGASLDFVRPLALAEKPDLFLTDFEPITALAAASLRAPCVSIDNQHRFCHPLGTNFPLYLQLYSRLAGEFVQRWIKQPRQCIVAVFHRCPLSRHYRHVDVLLRSRIAELQPTSGDHVLLYGRGALGRRMARVASTVPERFIAYGFEAEAAPNIEYKQPSAEEFVRDLASCKAVVTTAGQQLIGEARYFNKPMLIVPLPRQHEQEINARYAQIEGLGHYCPIERLSANHIRRCLDHRVTARRGTNGVDQIVELLGIGHG